MFEWLPLDELVRAILLREAIDAAFHMLRNASMRSFVTPTYSVPCGLLASM
jgi:hypothetical protein